MRAPLKSHRWESSTSISVHPRRESVDASVHAASHVCLSRGAQFLDTKDAAEATVDMPLPKILESTNRVNTPRKSARTAPNPETVWVDCFYYGFYMEKARLPAFQASLRQHQQASRPQVAGS